MPSRKGKASPWLSTAKRTVLVVNVSIASSSAFSRVDLLYAVVLIDAAIGFAAKVGHFSITSGRREDLWVRL